jgi:hypothetical protein
VISAVCAQVEAALRDAAGSDFQKLPATVFYSLRLHQINAFGYRPDWAEPLLTFVRFDSQGRPYFAINPETPEAHRHKFLCSLALSDNSPGHWKRADRSFRAADFVEPILGLPVEEWGDRSVVPEPSWTLQFLSAFLDEKGRWRGQETPLAAVTRKYWETYFQDFANGNLWHPGKTPFTETGLHFLEAVNKLCLRQTQMAPHYFPELKRHVETGLQKARAETSVLLGNPDWIHHEARDRLLEIAIGQLLVLGHLLEVCFHPHGALVAAWNKSEIESMGNVAQTLAELMQIFFDPRVLDLMNEEQKHAHLFPLLHAYHAIRLSSSGPLTIPRRS